MCERKGAIRDYKYKELPEILPKIKAHFEVGKYITKTSVDEEKIPRLAELFKEFPSIPMNIDLKIRSKLLAKKVKQLILKHNRESITT